MSLKKVHVLFMVAATMLALFCAVVAFDNFRADGSPLMAAASAGAVGAAVLMVRYEAFFLGRCRRAGVR